MSVEISFRRSRLADAAEMAPEMRIEEMLEVRASAGFAPQEALEAGIRCSDAWTVRANGKIMAIYGVFTLNLLTGMAIPWVLTTGLVDRHPKIFYKLSREVVAVMRSKHGMLVNMVDARYAKALRWVRRLGFEVHPPEPFGFAGMPFCRITMRGNADV